MGRLFVGGDFNLVMDNELDHSAQRFGQVGAVSPEGLAWLLDHGLADVWWDLHQGGEGLYLLLGGP